MSNLVGSMFSGGAAAAGTGAGSEAGAAPGSAPVEGGFENILSS